MINHNGFTFRCDGSSEHYDKSAVFTDARARTLRTAVAHARANRWFIGTVRITSGAPMSKVKTVKRTLCPMCKWLVGAP